MSRKRDSLEPATTDITITPDGRVFVFGLSRPVLEICRALNPRDEVLQRRLERLHQHQHESPSTFGEALP